MLHGAAMSIEPMHQSTENSRCMCAVKSEILYSADIGIPTFIWLWIN